MLSLPVTASTVTDPEIHVDNQNGSATILSFEKKTAMQNLMVTPL